LNKYKEKQQQKTHKQIKKKNQNVKNKNKTKIIIPKIINPIVFLFLFGKFYVHDLLLIIDCMELILI
jgi:hypothetical protein